ncbi:MAG TPA: SIMPL domain-containing protein [Cyclobacteriaceae bacterium]|nr:SIMPL domain-containing protein [Cyclobacteriaceae bacterium]
MRTILILLLASVSLTTIAQTDHPNYIEVRGHAVVKVVPDLIYLRIQISEKQKYQVDLDAKEKQMLERLKSIGINLEKDLVVKDLASNFQSRAFSSDNIVISKAFLLCTHDAKTANKVISELEKLEISNVIVDHLDHTNLEEFKKECNINAMVAAKSKADYMTQAIEQSVGRALYINEVTTLPKGANESANTIFYGEKKTSAYWNDSVLDFDEIKLECAVFARFELK